MSPAEYMESTCKAAAHNARLLRLSARTESDSAAGAVQNLRQQLAPRNAALGLLVKCEETLHNFVGVTSGIGKARNVNDEIGIIWKA